MYISQEDHIVLPFPLKIDLCILTDGFEVGGMWDFRRTKF